MEKRHFVQIVNENRGIINSLCASYYHSDEERKDAFQEIILQLWKSFDSFRGESKINTWIYRVSLNTLLSIQRKGIVETESIDTTHLSISNVHADDDLELLHLVIQSLKGIDKAMVILYLEGYQNKEIAEMLELTPTNVATRFNRLKSQLKMRFNNKPHATRKS